MKIGLYFDLRNPPPWRQDWSRLYGFTLEMCQEAERLGAHSVWLTEHHGFDDGYLPQPLTFAAAIAARTTKIRIGTAVLIAPFRSPMHIAEEVAVIDILSGGRFDLGLGAGYRIPEFQRFGVDLAQRYEATDECARQVRQIWREQRIVPSPLQNPVPIWMGYQGPNGARRAGLLGEGLLSSSRTQFEPYLNGLIEGGHDPTSAKMTGSIQAWVSEDPDRDWATVSKHLAYQMDSYNRYMVEGTTKPVPRPVDPDRLLRSTKSKGGTGYFINAVPEDVARRIREATDGIPVKTVYLWASIAGMPEAFVAKHIETICTKLAPLLS